MNVILSIKPEFANAILSGEKKVEFRKTSFKKKVEKVFIYSTSPIKKIVGFFTFTEINEDSPENLWNQFGGVGSINETDFFKYFGNKSIGFAIQIDSVKKFPLHIDPYVEIQNFIPPQSFIYYERNLKNRNEKGASHS